MNETIDFEMNICSKCAGKCRYEGLLTQEDVNSILNNEYEL